MANRDQIGDARSEPSDLYSRATLSEYLRYDRDQNDADLADSPKDDQVRRETSDPNALRHIKEALTANRRAEGAKTCNFTPSRPRSNRVDYPFYDQTEHNVVGMKEQEVEETDETVAHAKSETQQPSHASLGEETSTSTPAHQNVEVSLSTTPHNPSSATSRQFADAPDFEINLAPNSQSRAETEGNYRRLSVNRRVRPSMPILTRFFELVGQTQEAGRIDSEILNSQANETTTLHSQTNKSNESTPGVTVALAIAPEYLANSTMVGVFEEGAF